MLLTENIAVKLWVYCICYVCVGEFLCATVEGVRIWWTCGDWRCFRWYSYL